MVPWALGGPLALGRANRQELRFRARTGSLYFDVAVSAFVGRASLLTGPRLRWQRLARRNDAGLTLVETIIVIAIVGILAAILSLSIRQIRSSWVLRQAATTVVSELNRARTTAIAESVVYAVAFVPGGAGDPSRILVYRPGLQFVGSDPVSASSTDADDDRTVIVTGRTGNTLVSEVLTLKQGSQTGAEIFDWVLEALVTVARTGATITVTGGASPVTIGSGESSASIPWTRIRSVAAPEWPASVTISNDATTTFDACPADLVNSSPDLDDSSLCVLFGPSGEPVQSSGDPGPCSSPTICRIRLESEVGPGRFLYVVVEPATGRVSVVRE